MPRKKTTSNNLQRSVKKRNWAFVLYPESAPENWLDSLGFTDGTLKKRSQGHTCP